MLSDETIKRIADKHAIRYGGKEFVAKDIEAAIREALSALPPQQKGERGELVKRLRWEADKLEPPSSFTFNEKGEKTGLHPQAYLLREAAAFIESNGEDAAKWREYQRMIRSPGHDVAEFYPPDDAARSQGEGESDEDTAERKLLQRDPKFITETC